MNPHGCENGVPSASSFPQSIFSSLPRDHEATTVGSNCIHLVGRAGWILSWVPLGPSKASFQPGASIPSTLISIKRKWWGKLLFLHCQCTYMGNQDPKGRNCLKSQVLVAEWGEFMSPDIIYIYRSDGSSAVSWLKTWLENKANNGGKIITKVKFTAAGT